MRKFVSVIIASVVCIASCSTQSQQIDREEAEAILVSNINIATEVDEAIKRVARLCMENLGHSIHPPEPESLNLEDFQSLFHSNVLTQPDLALPPDEIYQIGFDRGVAVDRAIIGDDGETYYVDDVDEFTLLPQSIKDEYYGDLYGSAEFEVEEIRLPDLGNAERAAGGCMRMAEDLTTDDDYPSFLNHAGLAGAKGGTTWEADHRVIDARISWSVCMGEAGQPEFESPAELRMEIAIRMVNEYLPIGVQPGTFDYLAAESEFHEYVTHIASIDLQCHINSRLEEVQEEVYWEYMIEYLSQNEAAFFSFGEEAQEILYGAQEILESGSI